MEMKTIIVHFTKMRTATLEYDQTKRI